MWHKSVPGSLGKLITLSLSLPLRILHVEVSDAVAELHKICFMADSSVKGQLKKKGGVFWTLHFLKAVVEDLTWCACFGVWCLVSSSVWMKVEDFNDTGLTIITSWPVLESRKWGREMVRSLSRQRCLPPSLKTQVQFPGTHMV